MHYFSYVLLVYPILVDSNVNGGVDNKMDNSMNNSSDNNMDNDVDNIYNCYGNFLFY